VRDDRDPGHADAEDPGVVAGAIRLAGCHVVSAHVQPELRVARRRGPVRRYLETRGVLGGHRVPHVLTRLTTADGIRLAGSYLPGPSGADAAVLLLHGFGASRRKPAYARLADGLSVRVPVLTLDLRGHGGSAGLSTFGDREAVDVAAGVDWLHAFGHRRVVVVGLSMGATAALHAAWAGAPVDALAVVSAPAYFRDQADSPATRRLEALWESPLRRRLVRYVVGISLGGPELWSSPPDPALMAADLTVPLLVVHGADDAYFPPDDADALAAAGGDGAVVWHEPAGFGHAEDGITSAFVDRLGAAIVEVAATGRFPDRDEAR
jgi:uncharacterized protein